MDISSNKLTKSLTRRPRHSYERETLWEKTEYFLIAVLNNAIRTNNIKAKNGNAEQNSKCWLCGDKNETIGRMISECSKLAQSEYITRSN